MANFHWKDSIVNPEEKLKVNGGAVLLSYIRPILSNQCKNNSYKRKEMIIDVKSLQIQTLS